MIGFSEKEQKFYKTDLCYLELPDDLVEVTREEHSAVLKLINIGHYIFSDLTSSEKRPSTSHIWQNGSWIATESPAIKYENYLKSLKPLSRRQFRLTLLDNGLLDEIEALIAEIEDIDARRYIEIEYQEATQFERLSPSVIYMCQLLSLDDERIDKMWEFGLTL